MSHFTVLAKVSEYYKDFPETRIGEIMDPFSEEAEDQQYMEFKDGSEEIEKEWHSSKTVTVVCAPNGKYYRVFRDGDGIGERLCVKNGLVYECDWGPQRSLRRTKKAKKHKVLTMTKSELYHKQYKTRDKFAEEYLGYEFYEDENAYGYYYNPNCFWDWYLIGGRWPWPFLVKKDCENSIFPDFSWNADCEMPEAPEGYEWCAGAAKKDIEWDKMREIKSKEHKKRFDDLVKCYTEGKDMEDEFACVCKYIKGEGMAAYYGLEYIAGESFDDFEKRNFTEEQSNYPISCYGIVEDGKYQAQGDIGYFCISKNEKDDKIWNDIVQKYIAEVDDEDLLVMLDCHI